MKHNRDIKIRCLISGEIDSDLQGYLSAFIKNSHNGTIFHTIEWNRIIREIFQTDFYLLLAENHETILGMMPLHLVRMDPLRVNAYSPPRFFEVPYGGPAFKKGLSYQECSNILEMFLDKTSYIENGISIYLHTAPNPDLIGNAYQEKSRILETGFVLLDPSLDDIWMGIKSKRRNMIRKAEKSQVTVSWGGRELLDDYYPMAVELSKRSGIRLQPKDYYKRVLERFGPGDEARIYLAKYQGRYLSGGIFLRFGEKGYYWHGASYPGMKNMGQNELIQWQVIQWLKASGCTLYDMIGIEKERLPHIALFKLGFVNEIASFEYIHFTPLKNKLYRSVYYLTRPQEAGRYLAGVFR